MEKNKGPVFVVGMNGSGTTMLLECLNNHPELFGYKRETKIIPYYMRIVSQYGDLSDDSQFLKLWENIRDNQAFRHAGRPDMPEDWRNTPRTLAAIFDRILRDFALQEGKTRWCEKTPMHAQHILKLSEQFSGAKFIHMVRDGRACAASFHRRWSYNPQLTIYRWKNVVRAAHRQGQQIPGRYLEVKYEELTSNPLDVMTSICQFLDVPFDEQVLSVSRIQKHSGSSDKKITSNKQTKWKSYFSLTKQQRLEKIAGRTLSEFGYDTQSPSGDYNPSSLTLKLWMSWDYFREGLRTLSAINMSNRRYVFGRMVNAVKNRLADKF